MLYSVTWLHCQLVFNSSSAGSSSPSGSHSAHSSNEAYTPHGALKTHPQFEWSRIAKCSGKDIACVPAHPHLHPHPRPHLVESQEHLSLIHISEPTRLLSISYAVFCLKKKK
eukprot:TRINITY_DN41074_c0_g1_i1.p1 TRINITY_DN41074_c0_g1~~TRINITY_DN41074_c0_g1_i1.p1  ORF type:complete len:112 (+),score=14.03 TRINITY_DN41074_c0_g1_i1:291-626(+)